MLLQLKYTAITGSLFATFPNGEPAGKVASHWDKSPPSAHSVLALLSLCHTSHSCTPSSTLAVPLLQLHSSLHILAGSCRASLTLLHTLCSSLTLTRPLSHTLALSSSCPCTLLHIFPNLSPALSIPLLHSGIRPPPPILPEPCHTSLALLHTPLHSSLPCSIYLYLFIFHIFKLFIFLKEGLWAQCTTYYN